MKSGDLPHQNLVGRRRTFSSPRVCDLGGLLHTAPVSVEIVLRSGQIPVAGQRSRHDESLTQDTNYKPPSSRAVCSLRGMGEERRTASPDGSEIAAMGRAALVARKIIES